MFDEDSTKYGLIDSLAPSSKIIPTESMDGTIGDVYNKEVRRRNFTPMCVYELVKSKF